MAYDLEEQEQLASFKAFWNQYGNFILSAGRRVGSFLIPS